MEMFREIPPSSEARQVLSEEEMNRLLQKERDRMDGLYFEGMGLQDYLEMVDKEEAQGRYQDLIETMIESTNYIGPIVDAVTRRKQKAREPIKIYAEGGVTETKQTEMSDMFDMLRMLGVEQPTIDRTREIGLGYPILEMIADRMERKQQEEMLRKGLESGTMPPNMEEILDGQGMAGGGMVGASQPRQMEGIASVLADQGRYGDSMLVHMNPAEVQGLASLSPTGSLTVNPQTGQPEAFLGMILGALGSLGAGTGLATTLGLGGLSSAALGAIGSGLGTFIETGDLKKGLLGGLTGYGIGKFVGGLGGAKGVDKAILSDPTVSKEVAQGVVDQAVSNAPAFGENISTIASNVSQDPEMLLEAATAAGAAVPAAVGLGGRAAIEAEEAMERQFGADAARQKAIGERQDQIIAQSGFDPFLQPAKVPVSNYGIDTDTYTASAGGIVSIDPNDFRRRREELMRMGMPVKKMFLGGNTNFDDIINPIGAPGGLGPANRQAALRGSITLSPEELDAKIAEQGMPGFGPEINYFREPTPEEIEAGKPPTTTPGTTTPGVSSGGFNLLEFQTNPVLQQAATDYANEKITLEEYQQIVAGIMDIPAAAAVNNTASQNVTATTAGANAARDYSEYAEGGEVMPEGGIDPDRLITLAQMAVRGELPEAEAEVVIEMFMDQFGAEAFAQLRENTLESVVPGSQKEGEIVGQGGGMDDLVQGMIGTQQPVAVSPGEYIVPADVVSGLGDGSTDAGVQELDGMLDRVRVERTGTTQQPAPLAKGGMLPR